MDADLDTLCTVVYCTADDLLPDGQGQRPAAGHRRRDRHALRRPGDHGHPLRPPLPGRGAQAPWPPLPRALPSQAAYYKRRRRLADAIEWLMASFAGESPGCGDDLLLIDSTPVECARSRETVKRSALAEARRLRLLRRPLALVLGLSPARASSRPTAPRGRSRWPRPSSTSARSALELLRALPARGRSRLPGRRQGLCRARVRRAAVEAARVRPRASGTSR